MIIAMLLNSLIDTPPSSAIAQEVDAAALWQRLYVQDVIAGHPG